VPDDLASWNRAVLSFPLTAAREELTPRRPMAYSTSPDSAILAAALHDGTVRVYQASRDR
jgi:hypothetical protein